MPRPMYFLATLTTSRRLASVRRSRASGLLGPAGRERFSSGTSSGMVGSSAEAEQILRVMAGLDVVLDDVLGRLDRPGLELVQLDQTGMADRSESP